MWERVSSFVERHRRRLAGLVLVAFVLGVALDLSHTAPRATHLVLELGEGHDEVRAVELDYSVGDEAVEHARHRYPGGAPARIHDELDLVPGRYTLRLDATYADGHRSHREGEFDAPGEGDVVVSWRQ